MRVGQAGVEQAKGGDRVGAAERRVVPGSRRGNGPWETPGDPELGESIEAGVHREVKKATGAAIAIERLTGVYKNLPRGIVALVFRCALTSEPDYQSAEASIIQWHEVADVSDLMDEAYAVRVLDAT